MKVMVYWNLTRKCWSLMNPSTRRVIGYADRVLLTNCTFKVSEAGRQRVIREKRKNVHAFVVGERVVDLGCIPMHPPLTQSVRYNPYETPTFELNGEPIFKAEWVMMTPDKQVLTQ